MARKSKQLNQLLLAHFDEGELRTLCFNLEIEYDDLRGDNRSDKARELVRYLERYGRIPELIQLVIDERPKITLPEELISCLPTRGQLIVKSVSETSPTNVTRPDDKKLSEGNKPGKNQVRNFVEKNIGKIGVIMGILLLGIILLNLPRLIQGIENPSPTARTETPLAAANISLVPTVTPTLASTSSRTPTPSNTATPTLTPTASQTSTVIPSPTVTATTLPTPSQTPTASPTPSRIPTIQPTPSQTLTAPPLIAPTCGSPTLLIPVNGATINWQSRTLQWNYGCSLSPGEEFDVRIWRQGEPHYGVARTIDTYFIFDASYFGSGTFYWSIAVMRGTTEVIEEANPQLFVYSDDNNNSSSIPPVPQPSLVYRANPGTMACGITPPTDGIIALEFSSGEPTIEVTILKCDFSSFSKGGRMYLAVDGIVTWGPYYYSGGDWYLPLVIDPVANGLTGNHTYQAYAYPDGQDYPILSGVQTAWEEYTYP